jgi:hypothetical protein
MLAPAADAGESWQLAPKFLLGQEIVYAGTITETCGAEPDAGGAEVRFEQRYDMETNVLVTAADPPNSWQIGGYTVIRRPDRQAGDKSGDFEDAVSIHLDAVKVNKAGKPTWLSGAEVAVSLDGWGPSELGYLFATPSEPVKAGVTWVDRRAGQQPIYCRCVGAEPVSGTPCVKIVCVQTAQNWSEKNVATPAWQTQSDVWIDPRTGLVRRVRRVHQMRAVGEQQPSRQVIVDYKQASQLRYHGQMLQERIAEFVAAHRAQTEIEQATSLGEAQRKSKLTTVKSELAAAGAKPHATPYQPVIAEMQRRVEKTLAQRSSETTPTVIATRATAVVGKRAANIVARSVDNNETITLKKLAGKNAVFVLADPTSDLSIAAVQTVVATLGKQKYAPVELYVVSTSSAPEAIQGLRERVPGKYTVCTGGGFDRSYGTSGVPHTIVIDAEGILRGNYVGYGPEFSAQLVSTIRQHGSVERVGSKDDRKSTKFLR